MKDSKHLFAINTKNIMIDKVKIVRTVIDDGQEQYMRFIDEHFEKSTKLLFDQIKKN